MQQRSAVQHADTTTPGPELDEEPAPDDSFIARQLSLIVERLAILENRFNRLEDQVKSGRHVAASVPSLGASTPRPNLVAESHAPQGSPLGATRVPSSTPVTPRRPKTAREVQPNVTPRSPTAHHASPHSHHIAMQAMLLSDDDVSGRPNQVHKSLPDHYFGSNPIMTPEQLSQALEHSSESSYFVVTLGLEPGIYKSWHQTAAVAKNVGGVWSKVTSKKEAIQVYTDAYEDGICRRIRN